MNASWGVQLRYLNSTLCYVIMFPSPLEQENAVIKCFSDVDWCADKIDRAPHDICLSYLEHQFPGAQGSSQ